MYALIMRDVGPTESILPSYKILEKMLRVSLSALGSWADVIKFEIQKGTVYLKPAIDIKAAGQ